MRKTTRRSGTALLLALSLALGACSDSPRDPPPTTNPGTSLPAAPVELSAAVSPGAVTLSWKANPESDLAGYRVFRAASANGPFEPLTPQPIPETSWRDTGVSPGVTYTYQVVAVNRAGGVSSPARVSATAGALLRLQNLDGVPRDDRLVFSRIGSLASPPANRVHDRVTLRVHNPGGEDVRVTGLPVRGPWTVSPAPTASAPLTVPAGGFLDLTVRFVAEGPGNVTPHLHEGGLTVESGGGGTAAGVAVQLAGLWQRQPESDMEPNIDQIRRAFGYGFALVDSGTPAGDAQVVPGLDNEGLVTPDGDEVIAPYWQRADPARPVTVTQLAAYQTQGNTATLGWFDKGRREPQAVVTSDGASAQSLLPGVRGGAGLASASFTPSGTFGLVVDGAEWSDPTLNNHRPDLAAGCAGPCGQHLRFWPVEDAAGQVVPNTYFMSMDYAGINYDYNDNVYLISNLKPAPVLMNVGGPTFTAPDGNVWTADRYGYTDQNGRAQTYTYYSPGNAVSQPDAPTSVAIEGTDNDRLYHTYRHNTLDTPLAQRVMTYELPVSGGTYQVRLHFAELFWTSAGRRVFDVSVEGTPVRRGLDIFAEAGGQNRALVVPVENVRVTDGRLTVQLRTVVDHTNISGIEVSR